MSDKYVERQMLKVYESASDDKEKDDALYRSRYLFRSHPGNANLTEEQRTIILDAAKCEGGKNE